MPCCDLAPLEFRALSSALQVFDHEQWASHRSTSRYFRHARGLLTSRIVRGLWSPLVYVGAISLAVCSYEHLLLQEALHMPSVALPVAGPFSLSTFGALRFKDARKMWGTIINRSRDIARQGSQWLAAEPQLSRALCRWTVAFPVTLMASLREDVSMDEVLKPVLLPEELRLLKQQQHAGTAVLQAMGQCVRVSATAKDIEKLRMDESISVLQDMMGGCERIFRTPIPLSYTRHTSRFLMCWLTLLPFCVADSMGWATVPITCGMAFFLFGIEEIGVQIEEPFGILALEAKLLADPMQQSIMQHAAAGVAAAAAELPYVPVSAADAGSSSSSTSSSELMIGGYTLPTSPAAVNNVLAKPQEVVYADAPVYKASCLASSECDGW
ncbi:Bestrophin, RFP-TM, chloride channel-domain-containing protein [Scenedesmus sp. NREL 46B-D3]|nr:Bestrophin, RFP-TM, chloride channel-domain-containing protein [Scenedesmus sp. NREL 46B-D3]